MALKIVKVSEKGQIALPRQIRKSIGIHQGDELILIEENGQILLQKSNQFEKQMVDKFKDIRKITEKSLKKIWNNKDDSVWDGYEK